MMRVGLFKPVHVKTLAAQEQRMLLTSRKLIQHKLLNIECTASLTRRSTGSASAGRCPHGDDGWNEFVTSADPAVLCGKGAQKIEPLHPSHPIMRRLSANLEEKQEPRVATSVRADRCNGGMPVT